MTESSICIRINSRTKNEFDAFCEELGMTMSTAISLFIKKTLKEKAIPFDLSLKTDPIYEEHNVKRILSEVRDLDNGKGKKHKLIEA